MKTLSEQHSQRTQKHACNGGYASFDLMATPLIQRRQQQQASIFRPLQQRRNDTGLPDTLKFGMEKLTRFNLDQVKVHYNSSKPAAVQAEAYTQGYDIHLASGQEKHLPHELGHVVQQMRGQVQANGSARGIALNDNAGLEGEASRMGNMALQQYSKDNVECKTESMTLNTPMPNTIIQCMKKSKKHEVSSNASNMERDLNLKEQIEGRNVTFTLFLEKINGIIKTVNTMDGQDVSGNASSEYHSKDESNNGTSRLNEDEDKRSRTDTNELIHSESAKIGPFIYSERSQNKHGGFNDMAEWDQLSSTELEQCVHRLQYPFVIKKTNNGGRVLIQDGNNTNQSLRVYQNVDYTKYEISNQMFNEAYARRLVDYAACYYGEYIKGPLKEQNLPDTRGVTLKQLKIHVNGARDQLFSPLHPDFKDIEPKHVVTANSLRSATNMYEGAFNEVNLWNQLSKEKITELIEKMQYTFKEHTDSNDNLFYIKAYDDTNHYLRNNAGDPFSERERDIQMFNEEYAWRMAAWCNTKYGNRSVVGPSISQYDGRSDGFGLSNMSLLLINEGKTDLINSHVISNTKTNPPIRIQPPNPNLESFLRTDTTNKTTLGISKQIEIKQNKGKKINLKGHKSQKSISSQQHNSLFRIEETNERSVIDTPRAESLVIEMEPYPVRPEQISIDVAHVLALRKQRDTKNRRTTQRNLEKKQAVIRAIARIRATSACNIVPFIVLIEMLIIVHWVYPLLMDLLNIKGG